MARWKLFAKCPCARCLCARLAAILAAAFMLFLPTLAGAQPDAFPSRVVTLVVSYPAGGLSDLPARALAPELQARLGVPVVVENRVGGSGMVAGAHVARSEPNGYTLLVTSSANVTNPQSVQMPYDVVADFAPIGMILEGPPLILITNPKLPYGTLAELIAYGRANPGKLNFGSSGAGTVNALAIAQLSAEAGIDIVDVPYRGITQAGLAVVAGEIQGAFVFQGAAKPLVAEGVLLRAKMPRKCPGGTAMTSPVGTSAIWPGVWRVSARPCGPLARRCAFAIERFSIAFTAYRVLVLQVSLYPARFVSLRPSS